MSSKVKRFSITHFKQYVAPSQKRKKEKKHYTRLKMTHTLKHPPRNHDSKTLRRPSPQHSQAQKQQALRREPPRRTGPGRPTTSRSLRIIHRV